MRFFVRKIAKWFEKKARLRFTGKSLDIILFQIAAVYGATDLYGIWTAGRFFLASIPDAVRLLRENRGK